MNNREMFKEAVIAKYGNDNFTKDQAKDVAKNLHLTDSQFKTIATHVLRHIKVDKGIFAFPTDHQFGSGKRKVKTVMAISTLSKNDISSYSKFKPVKIQAGYLVWEYEKEEGVFSVITESGKHKKVDGYRIWEGKSSAELIWNLPKSKEDALKTLKKKNWKNKHISYDDLEGMDSTEGKGSTDYDSKGNIINGVDDFEGCGDTEVTGFESSYGASSISVCFKGGKEIRFENSENDWVATLVDGVNRRVGSYEEVIEVIKILGNIDAQVYKLLILSQSIYAIEDLLDIPHEYFIKNIKKQKRPSEVQEIISGFKNNFINHELELNLVNSIEDPQIVDSEYLGIILETTNSLSELDEYFLSISNINYPESGEISQFTACDLDSGEMQVYEGGEHDSGYLLSSTEYYLITGLIRAARTNIEIFKSTEKATLNLQKAVDLSDNAPFTFFIDIIREVLTVLNDKDWAKKLYKKGEKKADDFPDLLKLANSLCEKLGDKEWAKKVYKKAENKAEPCADFSSLAYKLLKTLGENEWAKKVYKKAEDKAEDSDDFRDIADSIYEYFGDKEWAKKIYKKAEDKAENCDDYECLAESLRDNLDDKKWAKLLDQKAKELEDADD
jgi:hypothetical protein